MTLKIENSAHLHLCLLLVRVEGGELRLEGHGELGLELLLLLWWRRIEERERVVVDRRRPGRIINSDTTKEG
jgi:hypothetical protein